MTLKLIRILLLSVIILIVSWACNFGASPQPQVTTIVVTATSESLVPPAVAPTELAQSTQASEQPPPTENVVETEDASLSGALLNPKASEPGDIYYSETFEEMENWSYFVMRGEMDGFSHETFDNRLRIDIEEQDTWVYYDFEGGEFTDVRIDIQVENRASNTNYVGMICRKNPKGWYEVNILNTGEYVIYYVKTKDGEAELFEMDHGGSTAIKTGRKINDYAIICKGEELTILINGLEELTLPLRTGDFPYYESGTVGLSTATSFAIPVIVDYLKFVLSVP